MLSSSNKNGQLKNRKKLLHKMALFVQVQASEQTFLKFLTLEKSRFPTKKFLYHLLLVSFVCL